MTFGQIDRGRTDATGSRQHQYSFSRLQIAATEQRKPARAVRDMDGCSLKKIGGLRQNGGLLAKQQRLFRIGTCTPGGRPYHFRTCLNAGIGARFMLQR